MTQNACRYIYVLDSMSIIILLELLLSRIVSKVTMREFTLIELYTRVISVTRQLNRQTEPFLDVKLLKDYANCFDLKERCND